jgi:hypothetical protein
MIGAVLPVAAAAVLLAGAAPASAKVLRGEVLSGERPIGKSPVKLYKSGGGSGQIKRLGRDATNRTGKFKIRYKGRAQGNRFLYVTVGAKSAIRLAAVLGATPVPKRAVVNELTTVAAGYGLAQFIQGRRISGPSPGPGNAALMAANIANPRTGRLSGVLRKEPNGSETTTLRTVNSLANMIPRCARSFQRCGRFLWLARRPDGRRARNVLKGIANIAENPWQNVGGLFNLAGGRPHPYGPALSQNQKPSAWTVALRFNGDGHSLDGPGNIAFDAEGNGYVANNYEYDPTDIHPVCGAENLPVFGPDGQYPPNTPFTGGGLSGAGYGVTVAANGHIWVANFGFATPAPGCPADQQPPHDNVSEFKPNGKAKSPDTGYVVGGLNWPQGITPDESGTLWVPNCDDGSVTRIPSDSPSLAQNISGLGLDQPFDAAINTGGQAFVTGTVSDNVAVLEPDGTPAAGSPISSAEGGFDRPMGIASDSKGNQWVANSGAVSLPCPEIKSIQLGEGSLSLIDDDGTPVTSPGDTFTGGGLTIPWGISVDGDDTVWVANFQSRRISQFCGVREGKCPPGVKTGEPISPNGKGYFFNGLTRVTAVQPDPSGNVWAANNWKPIPDFFGNPGGYEMVVFVGAAEPLRTPVIGQPERLR